jgi:hypothetical protein
VSATAIQFSWADENIVWPEGLSDLGLEYRLGVVDNGGGGGDY